MLEQVLIQILLIAAFVAFALAQLLHGRSSRGQALRTLATVIFVIAAIIAILWPRLVNDVALAVGVGRGADLLLYLLVIFVFAQSLNFNRKQREHEAKVTELARQLALNNPVLPDEARK